jgi:CheY-like chemotaxis protein
MLQEFDVAVRLGLIPGAGDSDPFLLGEESHAEPRQGAHLPRVLVVDDERLIADTITEILNLQGFDAFCAYSGAEALKLATSFHPDYLLSDVMMPKINGFELALAMEKMLPAIKVMLISGQAGSSTIRQWQKENGTAFSVLAKPIHPDKLVQTLRSIALRD